MIKQNMMMLDSELEDLSNIVRIHQYPSLCIGYDVWKTKWSDSKDDNGNFNRYVEWGPFQDLVAELEKLNLMDNKIVLVYNNGIHIGFYDGTVQIGMKMSRMVSPYSISAEEIKQKLDKKTARELRRAVKH